MSEQVRKRVVYGALMAAIIYGAYNFLPGNGPVDVKPPETIQPLAGPAAADQPKLAEAIIMALEEQSWGRDPFGGGPTPVRQSAPRRTWTLGGIIYNAAGPLAYINGERVGVGDKVNNATVVAIDKKKVTLEFDGRRFDVFVHKG